jgi:hypothetical protein
VRVVPSINTPTRVNPSLFCSQKKEPWAPLPGGPEVSFTLDPTAKAPLRIQRLKMAEATADVDARKEARRGEGKRRECGEFVLLLRSLLSRSSPLLRRLHRPSRPHRARLFLMAVHFLTLPSSFCTSLGNSGMGIVLRFLSWFQV